MALLLQEVNSGLTSFVNEMKRPAVNMWNNVAIVTVSDFGRTLTSNGVGTDHAWGGNHVIMGGAVKGGLIHGQYLDDMTAAGARVLSRGRVIPTLPWEAMWYPIAQWMGVADNQLTTVL